MGSSLQRSEPLSFHNAPSQTLIQTPSNLQNMIQQPSNRIIPSKSQLQRIRCDQQAFWQSLLVRRVELQDHCTQCQQVRFLSCWSPAFIIWQPFFLYGMSWSAYVEAEEKWYWYVPKKILTQSTGATPVTGSPIVER